MAQEVRLISPPNLKSWPNKCGSVCIFPLAAPRVRIRHFWDSSVVIVANSPIDFSVLHVITRRPVF